MCDLCTNFFTLDIILGNEAVALDDREVLCN